VEDTLYLDLDGALAVYAAVFECSAEEARDQLRSPEGLEAALSRPRSYAYYRQADLALQAAVLAPGIAEGQVFVEGNKRTALAAMATFLDLNGKDLEASQQERFRWMVELSDGLDPEALAERVRRSLIELTDDVTD
jgi:death-on-curing protein